MKRCGEALQRHYIPCKQICHKYGSVDCRFGFPHEVIPEGRFNSESNSILLKCLDPYVNWFNPYILVFARHNHDVQCILSGKAAKSAMMYITDYITKSDEEFHQVLSLFCRALAVGEGTDAYSSDMFAAARQKIHKFLSAALRAGKVHGQQAVRYLKGKGDSIKSHESVPMLSGAIVRYFRSFINPEALDESSLEPDPRETEDGESNSDDDDDPEFEPEDMLQTMTTDRSGKLITCDQIDDFRF